MKTHEQVHPRAARLQQHIDAWRAAGYLQGAVAISLPDGQQIAGAGGLADPAHQLENRVDTVFRVGSLSKSFTAAAVLQQIAAGKIALDTPLARFYPQLANAAQITIEDLLRHRSGVANFTAQPDYWTQKMRLPHSPAELIAWIHTLQPEYCPAGQHAYSNSGYTLLAAIVEQVAGQDFHSYRQQHLFDRLGLTATFVDGGRHIIPRAARGLLPAYGMQYAEALDMSVAFGAFDIAASVGDISTWLIALRSGALLGAELSARMLDIERSDFAFGFCAGQWLIQGQPQRLAQHFGDVNGFFAMMSLLPNGGNVVVLNNAFGMPVDRLARELACIAAGETIASPPPLSTTPPDAARFASGEYRADDGKTLALVWRGGHLYACSTRRYGVPVSYPLWAINDQQWWATASILPEQFTVQDNGELLWRDAEGISRTMRRVQAERS